MITIKGKGFTLDPDKEVVLYDEDVEKEVSILTLLKNGTLIKVSDEEPLEKQVGVDSDLSSNISKIIQWIRNSDSIVAFVQDNKGILSSVTLSVDTPTKMYVGVTDADGTVDIFANDVTVTLTPSSGITVNPTSGTVVDGKLEVTVTASQDGTIELSNDKNLQNVTLSITVSLAD
jgi:hypothetical protein